MNTVFGVSDSKTSPCADSIPSLVKQAKCENDPDDLPIKYVFSYILFKRSLQHIHRLQMYDIGFFVLSYKQEIDGVSRIGPQTQCKVTFEDEIQCDYVPLLK